MGGKITVNVKELHQIEKEETRAHRKRAEAHYIEKGCLSRDSDAPQVGSARSDSTRVVGVNRKMNHYKTRPYCTSLKESYLSSLHFPVLEMLIIVEIT
jgi:hypothetical protein